MEYTTDNISLALFGVGTYEWTYNAEGGQRAGIQRVMEFAINV